eukprot:TRINITY_DN6586_c0_g2_i1.p1 TRINITY_DN6586_c0_g2~~TRINITY_DN6586_c0_g2_i1.p1  ORF type:complete len:337 (+),score=72.07 TRINITY_DN6586_c0_g2_i1:130-1140(+)
MDARGGALACDSAAVETCAKNGYRLRWLIGNGTFADVFAATREDASSDGPLDVAIKVIQKGKLRSGVQASGDGMRRCISTEVAILDHVKHDGVVRLFSKFEDQDRVFLVLEQMRGGELLKRLVDQFPNGYSEADAAEIARQVVDAVDYLHSQGVVHRDLKPENLLFAERRALSLKITDFGLAQIYREDMLFQTACGSPHYMAPEVLRGQGYTFSVDMWSVGCVVYVILCGFCPFNGDTERDLFRRIIRGEYTFPSPAWDHVSDEAKDFIRQCLSVNPDERITPQEAAAHPFLTRRDLPEEPLAGIADSLRRTVHARAAPKDADEEGAMLMQDTDDD